MTTHADGDAVADPCAEDPGGAASEEKSRLTALQGLAALSLDALSSVAYGPEAIVVVLVAAGAVGLEYTAQPLGICTEP